MKLAALLGDGAVLQREKTIPIRGWCQALSKVHASLNGVKASGMSGMDGMFLLYLPPMAAGGAYTLEVATDNGKEKVEVHNIMIGDVYLASGQSNMEFHFERLKIDVTDELRDPDLRIFTVKQQSLPVRALDVVGSWLSGDDENLKYCSALSTFFAANVRRDRQVPVGIICSAWGNTPIKAWTSRETLSQDQALANDLAVVDAAVNQPEFWQDFRDEDCSDMVNARNLANARANYPADPGMKGLASGWAEIEFDDSQWDTMEVPAYWKSERNVPCNGILWFRREFELPENWYGKDVIASIGAVDKHDITYCNGEWIGATGKEFDLLCWEKPRYYRIPATLLKKERNVLSVRAYSFVRDGGLIGPAESMYLTLADDLSQKIPLNGVWRYSIEHALGNISWVNPQLGPGNPWTPGMLFDNMIHPLLPVGLSGVLWYQGEADETQKHCYEKLMKSLIRDWRFFFAQGDLPFIIVQLANFRTPENYSENSVWALIREAQMQALELPRVGMACIIDAGEASDIHPRDKKTVADRLWRWVDYFSGNTALVPSGPIYRSMCVERGAIRLYFDHAGKGLVARNGELKTFVIAGADGVFYPAEAQIERNTVVVKSEHVPEPQAVRYAWADNPEGCNLYNLDGLPASPFRTDC